ncbi:ABC transporter permease [Dysgonomonas sp. ZJ279]|uniref:ABC transporter permease n=1 Tax=Dysgonomonas sp. ZJ279 TaxID=2709796 RepID=UPI0013EC37D0|nr:ABC transporter permease [Dysgonomonas sp. ZJ279]
MKILSILQAEHFKIKRDKGLFLVLLFPITITVGVSLYIAYNYFNNLGNETFAYNPWTLLLGRYIFLFYSFFYPLIIAVFCHSFCDMEYKNNSLKQLFTLPIKKRTIFLAKIVLILEVVFFSVSFAYLAFMVSGYSLSFFFPRYCFQDYDIRILAGVFFLKLFLSVITISIIQYLFSMLFKSFVLPIAICCLGITFSLLANGWEYVHFIPYSSILQSYNDFTFGAMAISLNQGVYINISYSIIFGLLSFKYFVKMKI